MFRDIDSLNREALEWLERTGNGKVHGTTPVSYTHLAADISINRLRKRAGVADMEVAKIDASFDPNRDKGNNPHCPVKCLTMK